MKGWQVKEEGPLFVVSYIVITLILKFTVNPPLQTLLGVSLAISLALTALEVLADIYVNKTKK